MGAELRKGERTSLVRFRLHGRDIHDPRHNELRESVFNLLDISFFKDGAEKARLHDLTALDIRSLYTRKVGGPDLAWSLYLGRNRTNSSRKLAWDGRLGAGIGMGNRWMGGSLVLEAGGQQDEGDGRTYLSPRGALVVYLAEKVKVGASAFKKYGGEETFSHGELFMSWDVGPALLIATRERTEPGEEDLATLLINWKL